jgi:predicted nucleic acid-binding Zn finger protein
MSSKSVQPEIEPRTVRAATEYMTVIEEARALFEVTTQSGSAYRVDLEGPACECPDFAHREGVTECKHIRRVRMEVGQVDLDALEEELLTAAEDLESNAAELEEQAEELTAAAAELRKATERLREVAR